MELAVRLGGIDLESDDARRTLSMALRMDGRTFRGRAWTIEGEPDEELLGDGIAFKGVARYPVRVKCALLGWMAFKDAAVRSLGGQGGGETVYGEEQDETALRAARGDPAAGER